VKFFKNRPSGKILTETESYSIAAFFGILLGIFLFTFYSSNYYNRSEPVQFEILKGQPLSKITDSLYEFGIIPSKSNFRIASFIYGAESKIKAGRYQIPNGLSYFDLLDLLIEGYPDEQQLVTIPEGIWHHNLAHLLKKEINVDSVEFMRLSKDKVFLSSLGVKANSLEGYLLPETYYFYTNSTAKEVIKRLFRENNKFFTDSIKTRMVELKMSKHQILTLASIIDGESNVLSEYKTISAVYHNRLKKRMPLQADPTIQYLIRNRRHNRILYKDLEIDSPFNTYKYYGLPPAPINNPGKEAIYAALYPEENNFYYFVANGNGGHVFARTFSEHLRNVSQYRKWRRENNRK